MVLLRVPKDCRYIEEQKYFTQGLVFTIDSKVKKWYGRLHGIILAIKCMNVADAAYPRDWRWSMNPISW